MLNFYMLGRSTLRRFSPEQAFKASSPLSKTWTTAFAALLLTCCCLPPSSLLAQCNPDLTPPTAQCFTAITISLGGIPGGNGITPINPGDLNDGSFDNCGAVTFTSAPSQVSCADVNTTFNVTLTVWDDAGLSNSCVTSLTVVDNAAPVITCPANKTVSCGTSTAPSSTGTANAGDNCGGVNLPVTFSDNTSGQVGCMVITRTFSATYAGLVSTCQQTITTTDNVAPVIDWNGAVAGPGAPPTSPLNLSCSASLPAAVFPAAADVDDNCDPTPTTTVTDLSTQNANPALCSHYSYQILRTYRAQDNCGNITNYVQTINVSDTTDPVFTGPNNVNLQANPNCSYVVSFAEVPVTVSDNCTGNIYLDNSFIVKNDINNQVVHSGSGLDISFTYPAGDYTVTFTSEDLCGNSATKTVDLKIVDVVAPTAICEASAVQVSVSSNGIAEILPSIINDGSNDNCTPLAQLTLSVSPSSLDCSNVGGAFETITLTVTDANGNSNTCTASIDVVNNSAPAVFCKNLIRNLSATPAFGGEVTVNASAFDDGSIDLCDADGSLTFEYVAVNGAPVGPVSSFTFDCGQIGDNSVTIRVLEVDDNQFPAYTNEGFCTQTIKIRDITDPVPVCNNLTFQLDEDGMIFTSDIAVLPSTTFGDLMAAGSTDNCSFTYTVSPTMFNCNDVGDQNLLLAGIQNNDYTLTLEDPSGNTATITCPNAIIIQDNVAPVISCASRTISTGANGNGEVTVLPTTFVSGGLYLSSGNNGSGSAGNTDVKLTSPVSNVVTFSFDWSYSSNNSSPSWDPFGYVIGNTFTQLTNSGGALTQSGTATVTLTVGQTFAFRAATLDNIAGNAEIWITNFTPTFNTPFAPNQWSLAQNNSDGKFFFYDACGIPANGWAISVNGGPFTANAQFDCDDITSSPISIRIRATDVNGNSTICGPVNLTLVDQQPPQAQCQPLTVSLNGTGDASILASDFDFGSNDACCDLNLTFRASKNGGNTFPPSLSFDCDDIGTHDIILKVIDCAPVPNSAFCQTTVTIVDNLPPAIICPANLTVSCSDNNGNPTVSSYTGLATATDNCSASVTISQTDINTAPVPPSQINHPNCQVITRRWSASDGANTSVCFQTITVVDLVAPQLDWNGATAGLGTPPSSPASAPACTPPAPATPTGVDNCAAVAPVYVQVDSRFAGIPLTNQFNSGQCGFYNYTLSRTWTVTDNCGNASSYTQTLNVSDSEAPVFSFQPQYLFDNNTGVCAGTVNINLLAAIADCAPDNRLTVTYQIDGGLVQTGGVVNTILFVGLHSITVTAVDPCGNTTSGTFIVQVRDTESPVAKCKTGPLPISLNSNGIATITPADINNNSTDNCSGPTLTISQSIFNCSTSPNPFPVTLTVTDGAGNFNVCTTTVFITNATPPTITCPAPLPPAVDFTVSCDVFVDSNPATSGGSATANTACGPVTPTYTDTDNGGPLNCRVITRTWSVTNAGGTATCQQTINIFDGVLPVLVGVPGQNNNFFNCNNIPTPPVVTATDNCASPTVAYGETSTQNANPALCGHYSYDLTRTWTTTDNCNQPVSATRTVLVRDIAAPKFDFPVGGITISTNPDVCTADVNIILGDYISDCAADQYLAITNTGQGPGLGVVSGVYAPGDYTITVTATDPCQNAGNATFVLHVEDNEAPQAVCHDVVIVTLDGSGNGSLTPQDVDDGSLDNCAGITLSLVPNTFTTADIGTTNVVLTVTDAAGNTNACAAQAIIGEGVVLTPGNVTGTAGSVINVPVTVQGFNDICALSFSVHVSNVNTADVVGVNGFGLPGLDAANFNITGQNITLIWTDNTGNGVNLTDGSLLFNIAVELGNTVNNVSTVTINGNPTSLMAGSCDGVAPEPDAVSVTVSGPGSVTIVNVNQTYILAGDVTVFGSQPVDGVNLVNVALSGTTAGTQITGVPGTYSFTVNSGSNSTITPTKDIADCNGVNVFDALLIQQHLLNATPFTNYYQYIAADINNDGFVNVFDLGALQFMFVSATLQNPCPGFTNNTSWRFVDASWSLPALPGNAQLAAFPESITYNPVTANHLNTDFFGVKIGDLDLTANPALIIGNQDGEGTLASNDAADRSGKLEFVLDDQAIAAGNEYRVEFKAKDFNDMMAYQYTLGFDKNVLKYKAIEVGSLPGLTSGQFGTNAAADGYLNAIWLGESGVSMADGEVLFTVVFDAVANAGKLSDLLYVDTAPLAALAYTAAFEEKGVTVVFNTTTGTTDVNNGSMSLYQNRPNPFTEETIIPFYVPAAAHATLTLTDVSGKTVKVMEGDFSAGNHSFAISRKDMPATGVFFYRLEALNGSAVRKMILMD